MIKNTESSYGSIAKFLHWFMAILILFMIALGYLLEQLDMPELYKIHKATGFFILLLAVARLFWRIYNVTPKYTKMPKWMIFSAHFFHYGLYALVIIMALSAFIASNAAHRSVSFLYLFDMPSLFAEKYIDLAKALMKIHEICAILLIAGITAHISVAFYHHYIRKDNVLLRMIPNFLKSK